MNRRIKYDWNLRTIMAARGMNNVSDLMPPLQELGIDLSASQLYRLLGRKPERLPLPLLGAICTVLECTVEDLCAFRVEATSSRRAAAAGQVVGLDRSVRPKRAHIRRPGE
ncbi:helix-turn-helix transcriptional regulator (plasmid) [Rhodococcus opacus]|uniref:helix-turn-helix domain-containing protein n=1 Tax=Rhodococcus opacus TaxID=37919 RepID=UPI000A91A206|nr:helix-turn-helix transcriptional regulator [Rhodococcus sp. IEGM 248]WKN60909.1 helix-turn-helix transcriptional regulator [Rhodococcus opacus]